MRYTTTDCFENYPFPANCGLLTTSGENYYLLRQRIALDRHVGLTDLYQLMHMRSERRADIRALRDHHAGMDHAVVAAYGWDDLGQKLGHGFHETNHGIRFTISEPARREILTRLLKLNHERYAEEVAQGLHDKKKALTRPVIRQKAQTDHSGLVEAPLFAYPSTDVDRAICAASLQAVANRSLSSLHHLDLLILTTHPDWCEVFLDASDKARLQAAKRKASAALFIGKNGELRWKQCRDYLEMRRAIRVEHGDADQTIHATAELPVVKASFPGGADDLIDLAFRAMPKLHELREHAEDATKRQRDILAIFRQQEQLAGLVA